MLELQTLTELLKEKMGNSRTLSENLIKQVIIQSANDLISDFKQNVCIHTETLQTDKAIKIKNIAYIYQAKFNNSVIPLQRLSTAIHDNATKLIVLDTQSVRLEPFSTGTLEILGSFYIDNEAEDIPLSHLFLRALLQGATLSLFIMLDKPIEHIKNAKALFVDLKDELRTQLNRAQEKQSLSTKNIRI